MLIVVLDVVEETAFTLSHLLKASTNTKRNDDCSIHHNRFPWGIQKLHMYMDGTLGSHCAAVSSMALSSPVLSSEGFHLTNTNIANMQLLLDNGMSRML